MNDKMITPLNNEVALATTVHGTLVEVFSMGVLIEGESLTGKSETALALLDKGHRLISDDVVKIRKKDDSSLVGFGPKLSKHLMEIKNIGIINVVNLYGSKCVREEIAIDIVVKLEFFDPKHIDRALQGDKAKDILGIKVPFYSLNVNPGRSIALLIETLTLNQRLKKNGLDSAKEFKIKILQKIAIRKKDKSEIS